MGEPDHDVAEQDADRLAAALTLAVAWMEAIVSDGTLPETRQAVVEQAMQALAGHERRLARR